MTEAEEKKMEVSSEVEDKKMEVENIDQETEQVDDEIEEEWAEDLTTLLDEAFDLYEVLKIGRNGFNVDKARAAYHKYANRFHPEYSFKGHQLSFLRVTLAYAVLKDEDRKNIYDVHGFEGLVKSEEYMDPSVFETNPYDFYEDFFSGKDPADKEYFLLNGLDNDMSDSEDEQDQAESQEEEEEEEEEDVPQVELSEAEKAKLLEKRKEIEAKSFPVPPVSVMVSSMALPQPPKHPFSS